MDVFIFKGEFCKFCPRVVAAAELKLPEAKVVDVATARGRELAGVYGILSLPTVLYVKHQQVERASGLQPCLALIDKIVKEK